MTTSKTRLTIIPFLRYRDASAAIDWLEKAFGFERHFVAPGPDGTVAHAQLVLGTGMIMLGSVRDDELGMKSPGDLPGVNQGIYALIEDPDAHCERARAAGAEIVRPPEDTDHGSREYVVQDLEGHLWSFGTYDPFAEA